MPGSISRRDFFFQSVLYGGSVWAFVALPRPRTVEAAAASDAPQILRGADRKTVEAITGRIIPTDEEPGAIEAGCVNFIDKALANEESDARPIYETGLAGLRSLCLARFRKSFLELGPDEQDEILSSLSSGEVEGWPDADVGPQAFFEIVRLHTILGYLSDPKYGGNRGYAGWKVAGYSAPRGPSGYTAKQLVGEGRIPTIWEKPLPRTLEE